MARNFMAKAAALAALALPRLASGAQGDICYIENPQAVVIQDQMVFMGANYSKVTSNALGDDTDIRTSASILSLELNNQLPVENRIPNGLVTNVSVPEQDSVAYANAVKSRGALWHTNDTIYSIGEDYGVATNKLSAFDMRTRAFKEVTASGGNFNFGPRSGAQFVSVPEQKLGFLAGGFYFNKSSWTTGGLLRFDASDPDNLSWTNETLGDGSFGAEVPNLQGGAMVYVPAGKQGVLVTFGGGDVSSGISSFSGWPTDIAFTTVWVYDIASHTWWKQQASGTAPQTRVKFCTAVTTSPDGSAFHITTYGGWSLLDQRSYEDVYVLSIPSFRWINATGLAAKSNGERDVDETTGRDAASCHTYRGQMVVLGGIIRQVIDGKPVSQSGKCNGAFSPVRALDLSTYSWLSALNTTANYSVPPIIYNEIGGDASGGATVKEPKAGFANVGLSSVLAQRVPTATSSPGGAGSGDGGDRGNKDDSGGSSTGAIVGGVVGGVAAVALLVLLAWWLLRRRRRAAAANMSAASHPSEDYSYSGVPKASDGPSELHSSARPSEMAPGDVYQLPVEHQVHQLPSENQVYHEMPAR